MKFLIVAHRFHTNLYYRAIALQEARHQVKVLVLYKGKSECYESIDIQQLRLSPFSRLLAKLVHFLKKSYLKTSLEFRLETPDHELHNQIKSYRPDVILLKAYQNMFAIKTLFVAKRYRSRVLMLTQTPFAHIKGSKMLFKLNIWLFRKLGVHAYITPIRSNYDAFKNFGIENVFYVPFVFSVSTKVDLNFNVQKEIRIISVGKFVKRKDQLILLQAITKLKEKYPLKLKLFGEKADETYYEQIIAFVKANKLEKIVEIKLNVPYGEIQTEYAKHAIFVLPSYAEPAAYSPVEAMANGLAVICSSENGTKCYIEEGESGYIFKAKELNDLTKKLELLMSNPKKLLEMRKKALHLARKNHGLESFNNNIFSLLKNKQK